jgi:hypothetical protein
MAGMAAQLIHRAPAPPTVAALLGPALSWWSLAMVLLGYPALAMLNPWKSADDLKCEVIGTAFVVSLVALGLTAAHRRRCQGDAQRRARRRQIQAALVVLVIVGVGFCEPAVNLVRE